MTRRILILCVALPGLALAGCQAHNDFQKKWPKYPQWGWWNQPAKDVPEPTDEASADESWDEKTDSASPGEETTPREPATLEEHRDMVWEKVLILRDVDELPLEKQRKLIASARRDLRAWYRPMAVDPPDPDEPRWITVLVWDFMPEEDFDTAAENWRRTARREHLPFPQNVTRRDVMEFVGKVTRGELNPAARAKPTTSPAAAK